MPLRATRPIGTGDGWDVTDSGVYVPNWAGLEDARPGSIIENPWRPANRATGRLGDRVEPGRPQPRVLVTRVALDRRRRPRLRRRDEYDAPAGLRPAGSFPGPYTRCGRRVVGAGLGAPTLRVPGQT
jgi:hypothetical protein